MLLNTSVEYLIYKLLRDDGLAYIGTTNTHRFKNRMSQHRSTERFRNHTFTCEILARSADATILHEEAQYIVLHNTLSPHGLNKSWSGKGSGHDSPKFTTRGYRFSDESRKKMSEAAKRRCQRHVRTGWTHSEETRRRWADMRKGIDGKTMKGRKYAVRSK
jgi:hypothetical protein